MRDNGEVERSSFKHFMLFNSEAVKSEKKIYAFSSVHTEWKK